MAKTRASFFGRIAQALGMGSDITDETWDQLEEIFLQADMGVPTTLALIERLQERARKERVSKTDQLNELVKDELKKLLVPPTPLNISGRPLSVIMIVGVNGSGKTTTIGKLARRMQLNNRKTIIAAGDTFRAAAIDQLKIWGERADIPVIAGQPGMDPGAIVYDAVEAARARKAEILIIDTAGRLHSNINLMQELKKISNVVKKVVPDAPHETLLVLDGTTGQNALNQAKKFREMVDVTGIIVTKLDSSAKGGMVFAIQQELGLPIHYIGIGESIFDLVPFDPERFVDSLFEGVDTTEEDENEE
ncbi:MAG: signal recognition particle-docking protein FtsY [Phototrophicales bacterium]|nr:MAG: signal recognition particle-docking protein FtsY [Phototrophicales bacterium]